jgi:hypothetical protein
MTVGELIERLQALGPGVELASVIVWVPAPSPADLVAGETVAYSVTGVERDRAYVYLHGE